MYSIRTRSDSVGRGEREPQPYRPSYSALRETTAPSRSSRASSYDPFADGAARTPMSSPYRATADRSAYSRPSYSGMSNSYTDYSAAGARNSSSRYGSTEQLHYKSPFTNSSSTGYGSSTGYRSTSNFTRAGSVGFSMTDTPVRSYRDYTPSSTYTSTSRFRPMISSTTSTYQPRSSLDLRSKTPGLERKISTRPSRLDRDCRSMSRTEKTPITGDDEVERTFERLYNRYVRDDDSTAGSLAQENAKIRSFISHSEAEEEDSSEEELSPTEMDDSFAEKLQSLRQRKADTSVTPRGSTRNSPDATPKCSPMMLRKREERPSPSLVEEKTKEQPQKVENKTPAQEFREKHPDLEFKQVELPPTTLKSATSAMDKFIRRDSLSTKLCEAIEKRNSPSGQNDSSGKSSAVPSRSASPNVAPLPSKITSKIEENKASAPVSAIQPSPSPNASKAASPLALKKEATATNATSQQKNGTSTAKADLVPTISKGSQAKNSDTSKAASPSTVGKNASISPSKDSATPLTKAEERPKSPGLTQLKTTEENTPTNRKQAGKEHEASAEPRQQGRGSPAVEKKDSTSCGNIYLDTETKNESNPCQEKVASPDDLNKNSFETSASFSIPTNAKGSQEHSTGSIKQGSVPPLPIVVTSSIEDQTDRASRGKTSEPSTAVTILLTGINKRNRSRSVSPGRKSHHHRHQKEESPQLLTVSPNQHHHHKHEHHSRQSASPTMDRADQSTPQADDDSRKGRRKRRDPTRTLDNLKEKLATEKSHNNGGQNGTNALSESGASTSSTGSEEGVSLNETQNRVIAPLLLVTEPTSPHKTCPEEWEESTDADWTEAEDEADYESDFEYSVSQTFSLKDAMPIGDLYPLSRCSSRCSPFVSDYDSDSSMPLFTLPSRAAESRGRVDHLFAVPPPSFTCSITYDGQESWDDDSLHSCTEFDDEYYGRHSRFSRAGSSALGAYLSPGTYSSDEDFDGQHFHDEVDVGCTLRLVDKAALKGDSDDDDSEYYDDEEYSDEEYWDEDEEYDEEEGEYEEDEEYDEDEEELEEDEEESCDEMHSFAESGDEESLRSPYPLIVVQPVDDEEFVDMEEMDAEFDVEATVEIALPETVKPPEETTEKHREITYTKDMIIMTEEERAEQLRIEQEEAAKAIKKRVVKDGTSEKAAKTVVPQHVDVEEEVVDMEEMEAEFEVETVVEHALPEIIKEPEEKTEKYREVTYTKDLSLMTEEEKAEQLRIEQEQAEKAIKKRVVKDGASEKAGATRVPQRVVPLEETVALDESIVLPDEEICELGLQQHEDETGKHEVNVVPTFVRPLTEKIQEESASRFADKRVATDFAKKAVIQPPKLQTAAVQKVEAKIAPEKPIEPPSKKTELQKKVDESKTKNDVKRADETKAKDQAAAAAKVAPTSTASSKAAVDVKSKVDPAKLNEKPSDVTRTKTVEDKSGTRKSALNMTAEDAKRKAAADEEAAKQKARRFGTVSSMLNRFKEPEVKEEPITYKRSSYLEAKEVERPKKKYQVIKPAVDDSFDKQMEEIRKQMKSGSSQFESHLKDLSKGITATAEDMKKRTEDEKKKIIIDSVSGVFSKADEEKARWKEKRDAATEKELAKIEADKPIKKKVVAKQEKEEPEKKAEPKRTVRKIVKDKVPAAATGPVPSFATVPKPAVAPSVAAASPVSKTAAAATKPVTTSTAPPAQPTPTELPNKVENVAAKAAAAAAKAKAATAPSVKPVLGNEKPTIPRNDNVVNDDNYDLFEAATNVATRRRKSLAEMKARKEQTTAPRTGGAEQKESVAPPAPVKVGPKGDGAAATKIRNALGNATNVRKAETPSPKPDGEKSMKRYATRRKTQEIVNESAEPKVKKRRQMYKRNRFIRDPHDIDVLLGWDKENTFEKMEQMFTRAKNDRISRPSQRKRRRAPASKIWISDLTDIDKIYKASEIRDIIASANV